MKTFTSPESFLVLLTAAMLAAPAALARDYGGLLESAHDQELALGIAHPSLQNGIRENPAGLGEITRTKLVVQDLSLSSTSPFSSNLAAAQVLLGNGTVGGSIGYDTLIPGSGGTLRAGLAFETTAVALGLSCSMGIGGGLSTSCNNFGVIFDPRGFLRVGAQVITGTNPQYGGGVAVDLSSAVTFATDATLLNGMTTIKPSFGFQTSSVFGQFGYALTSGNYSSATSSYSYVWGSGFSAGLGMRFGMGSSFAISYSQVSPLYAGLTLQI